MSRAFDDANDVVDMGNNMDVTTGDFTIALWVKVTADTSTDFLIGKTANVGTGTAGYGMWVTAAELTRMRVGDGSNDVRTTATDSIDISGAWYFMAGTWDATSEVLTLWRDGESDATASGTMNSLTTASNFTVGEDGSGGSDVNGIIAYPHMYNRVLSASELKQIMRYPGSVRNGLQGFWLFRGASPEGDYSGNGHGGTVTGSVVSTDEPPISGLYFAPRPIVGYETTAAAPPAGVSPGLYTGALTGAGL